MDSEDTKVVETIDHPKKQFRGELFQGEVTKEWFWRLKSVQNGKTVADSSEGYENKGDCIREFDRVFKVPGILTVHNMLALAVANDDWDMVRDSMKELENFETRLVSVKE